jgi:hypothetical protein
MFTPPDGWRNQYSDQSGDWCHTDGQKQRAPPAGSKQEGVIALFDYIKNNGALTKFDISTNDLRAEGAKIIAAILPKCT